MASRGHRVIACAQLLLPSSSYPSGHTFSKTAYPSAEYCFVGSMALGQVLVLCLVTQVRLSQYWRDEALVFPRLPLHAARLVRSLALLAQCLALVCRLSLQ